MRIRLSFVLAALLAACRPDPPEKPLPTAPLLETLSASYRPIARQDTLESFWAPDSMFTDSLFSFTKANRSQVLMRVRLVPASAVAAARLDTLHFRRPLFRPEEYDRPGYHWDFAFAPSPIAKTTEAPDGTPLRLTQTYSYRMALLEYRRWPAGNTYERNTYLMDYPFGAVAEARVSDSVVYIKAFPLLADQPRPDTLFPYYHGRPKPRYKRIPFITDRPDTTRQALIRLSFRVLSHSAD